MRADKLGTEADHRTGMAVPSPTKVQSYRIWAALGW